MEKLLLLFCSYETVSNLLGKLTVSKTMQLNPTPNSQSKKDAKFSFFLQVLNAFPKTNL